MTNIDSFLASCVISSDTTLLCLSGVDIRGLVHNFAELVSSRGRGALMPIPYKGMYHAAVEARLHSSQVNCLFIVFNTTSCKPY